MTKNSSPSQFSASQLEEFERAAIQAVSKAGSYVLDRIASPMEIESKTGRPGRDLVTDVDRNSQVIIADIITERFPEHQFLGEEDQKENVDPATDLVWAVDPIDGTANYVNGSMTHAVSVGLMYRGQPIAGAVWSPWPMSENRGTIVHARLNGGTKRDGETTRVLSPIDELGRPVSGRLSVLPGNARSVFKFDKQMRGHGGDVRVTGSAAHEMANVGTGHYQYSIGGVAAVWDFAAATVIVREAGGDVMVLGTDGKWRIFDGWAQPYVNEVSTFKYLQDWRGIMLAAHPETMRFLAQNIRFRQPNPLTKMWRQRLGHRRQNRKRT